MSGAAFFSLKNDSNYSCVPKLHIHEKRLLLQHCCSVFPESLCISQVAVCTQGLSLQQGLLGFTDCSGKSCD